MSRRRLAAAFVALSLAAASCALAGGPQQDYILDCSGCHGVDGRGVPGKVPPLAHALARFMRSPIGRDYVLRVPGAADSLLSDAELAAVLNWIAERFDAEDFRSDTPRFTAAEVGRVRHKPLASVIARRREVVRSLAATGAAPPAGY